MKLSSFAIAVIATTNLLIPINLADSAKAEDSTSKKGFSITSSEQTKNDSWERNKQRYDRDRRDYYDDINRLYREVLGRNADNNGLRTWSRQLERGRSIRDIRRELAYSREGVDAINDVYRQVLGRNVDRNGLRTWQKELADGKSLREVRRSIQRSSEARDRRY